MLAVMDRVRLGRRASGVVSVHALVSTAAHAIAETDLTIGIDGSDAEWRPGCPSLDAGQCCLPARSEPESREGDTVLGCGMRTAGVANDSAAASHPGLALDHTGFIHFHSSTTSGSACLMSFRILLRVSPRQSPSSAILCEISCDADWPWLAPDFFMVSSSRGLNAELLCILRVQSLPASELHRLGTNDAADGGSAEQMIQNIEAKVPPGSTHRDEAAIDVGPQRQARAATNGFELPPHIEATPVVLEHLGSVGSRHSSCGDVRRGCSDRGELHPGSNRPQAPIGVEGRPFAQLRRVGKRPPDFFRRVTQFSAEDERPLVSVLSDLRPAGRT